MAVKAATRTRKGFIRAEAEALSEEGAGKGAKAVVEVGVEAKAIVEVEVEVIVEAEVEAGGARSRQRRKSTEMEENGAIPRPVTRSAIRKRNIDHFHLLAMRKDIEKKNRNFVNVNSKNSFAPGVIDAASISIATIMVVSFKLLIFHVIG